MKRRCEIGDLVIRKRDGVEVTVVSAWYDRNADYPSQLVLPVIEVEEHLIDRREYVFPSEIETPSPGFDFTLGNACDGEENENDELNER